MLGQAIQTFQINCPIRGELVTLPMLRRIYSDLSKVIEKKADEFCSGLKIPEGYTQKKFESERTALRQKAFKGTVTLASPTGANFTASPLIFLPLNSYRARSLQCI